MRFYSLNVKIIILYLYLPVLKFKRINYEGGNTGRIDLHSVLVGDCGLLEISWVLDQMREAECFSLQRSRQPEQCSWQY